MSKRQKLDVAIHSDYAKIASVVPSQWRRFVADVICYAAIMAWE